VRSLRLILSRVGGFLELFFVCSRTCEWMLKRREDQATSRELFLSVSARLGSDVGCYSFLDGFIDEIAAQSAYRSLDDVECDYEGGHPDGKQC